MATKNKPEDADDLLGGAAPVDDLLGGDPVTAKPAKASKPKASAKPAKAAVAVEKAPKATKAAKPVAATKPATKAAKPAAAPKPAKATGEKPAKPAKVAKPKAEGAGSKGARGTGKFFISQEELAALMKKCGSIKKPISTKDAATKLEAPTWKARLALAAMAKSGSGSLAKSGQTLTYTPGG